MPHHLHPQTPPLLQQVLANPNQVPPADVVQIYNVLVVLRLGSALGGLIFSISSPSSWPAFWHLILAPLVLLEGAAAGFSRTPNLRKKRIWTIANVILYFASLAVLAACFLVRDGRGRGGPPLLMLLFPDIMNLGATIVAFFTLPMLRIKNWRALPTDDGLLVGDAVPVVTYRDEEESEGESGALADAFRAQQEGQRLDGDEQSR
ncbi:hypothetical protein B0T14DRAFT_517118 [Immersiella caudata]|uniref:Uncharacterized protein n=1 Tax=Immersiella caudata TaxID=314043 RepID=A0AA39WYC4_9PEZI|nr:hypothetical protein B0T14DRAFT_517118 [Immersiella caudata]